MNSSKVRLNSSMVRNLALRDFKENDARFRIDSTLGFSRDARLFVHF